MNIGFSLVTMCFLGAFQSNNKNHDRGLLYAMPGINPRRRDNTCCKYIASHGMLFQPRKRNANYFI